MIFSYQQMAATALTLQNAGFTLEALNLKTTGLKKVDKFSNQRLEKKQTKPK